MLVRPSDAARVAGDGRSKEDRQALSRHGEFFLLIGGIETLLMRMQLAEPRLGLLSSEAHNQFMSMHGTTPRCLRRRWTTTYNQGLTADLSFSVEEMLPRKRCGRIVALHAEPNSLETSSRGETSFERFISRDAFRAGRRFSNSSSRHSSSCRGHESLLPTSALLHPRTVFLKLRELRNSWQLRLATSWNVSFCPRRVARTWRFAEISALLRRTFGAAQVVRRVDQAYV